MNKYLLKGGHIQNQKRAGEAPPPPLVPRLNVAEYASISLSIPKYP